MARATLYVGALDIELFIEDDGTLDLRSAPTSLAIMESGQDLKSLLAEACNVSSHSNISFHSLPAEGISIDTQWLALFFAMLAAQGTDYRT